MLKVINGSTPAEIKNGLKVCTPLDESCLNCSYADWSFPNCTFQRNRDAYAYIEHLETAQPKWISVEDELPPVGEKVLVNANNVRLIAFIDCEDVWHRDTITYRLPGEVTHWMPLPEPPKEVKE